MNKFEQVSSDHHQMSLAGGRSQELVSGRWEQVSRSDVQGGGGMSQALLWGGGGGRKQVSRSDVQDGPPTFKTP